MYAAIRRAKVKRGTMDQLMDGVENGFVPLIKEEQGFIDYYVLRMGDDEAFTISIFETRLAAEESNRKAAAWVKQHLADLLQGPLESIGVGQVLVHQTGGEEEQQVEVE